MGVRRGKGVDVEDLYWEEDRSIGRGFLVLLLLRCVIWWRVNKSEQ